MSELKKIKIIEVFIPFGETNWISNYFLGTGSITYSKNKDKALDFSEDEFFPIVYGFAEQTFGKENVKVVELLVPISDYPEKTKVLERMKNLHTSEDKTPDKEKKTQKEVECGASWQLYTNGSIGSLKCRKCGVYVTDGGTPKCLLKK